MSEPRIMAFRCFCLECDANDRESEFVMEDSEAGSPASDDEDNQEKARTIAGAIERLLFGR